MEFWCSWSGLVAFFPLKLAGRVMEMCLGKRQAWLVKSTRTQVNQHVRGMGVGLLGQSRNRSRLGAGDHGLHAEGGWSVCRVLSPGHRPHSVPDPHVVQLSVKAAQKHHQPTDNPNRHGSVCGTQPGSTHLPLPSGLPGSNVQICTAAPRWVTPVLQGKS